MQRITQEYSLATLDICDKGTEVYEPSGMRTFAKLIIIERRILLIIIYWKKN